jgi:hypothetical protein
VSVKHDIFDNYEEPRDGLEAWANVDPDGWSAFVEGAAERRYQNERAAWVRSQVQSVAFDMKKKAKGEVRLFELPESATTIDIRERLIVDGKEVILLKLAGKSGADVLRQAMDRDMKPALTTVRRCKTGFALADHIEAESERLRRDVSVAEVVTLVAAA